MTAKYGLDLGLEGQEKRNVCLAGEIKDLAQDERLMKATDQQFEIFLGKLLRTGVVIAALIVLAGGVWFLSEAHGARREYATFRGVPAELSSLDGIFHGAVGGQALGGDSVGNFGADRDAGGAGFVFDAGICAGERLDVCRGDGDGVGAIALQFVQPFDEVVKSDS
jgi:hypothetical protein